MNGIGDYQSYQQASGLASSTIAISDALGAIAAVTNNGSDLGRLTFDSFLNAMGRAPYNYPSSVIQSIISTAWPFIPEKYRRQLSRRSTPSLPPPSTPPQGAPVLPSTLTPTTTSTNYLLYGGVVVAIAGAAFLVLRRFAGRK